MTTEAAAMPGASTPAKEIFGHPRGLAYLVFAEAWERFSYYGMQALLVLYLTQYLLLPGQVENVIGFADLHAGIEYVRGLFANGPLEPLTPLALGSLLVGVYTSGVYFTPILGGLLADRVLGRTATVTIGAVLMALGHFLMAFEASFLLAIACLFVGVGCFKGNIASQVGELYGPSDLRRSEAYQLFLLGVQIAVIVSPLVCGTLGEKVAWHWGFGAAGVGMLIGLAVYLGGRRHLPPDTVRGPQAKEAKPPLTGRDWATMVVLIALLPVMSLAALGNQQIFNAYLVWGKANYGLEFFGQTMPVTWLLSLDAFISTGTVFGALLFWRFYSRFAKEPDEIVKLFVGALIAAGGPLMLGLASMQQAMTGEKISLAWGLAFHIVNDIGFAMVFPVGLALYSRASPKGVGGVIIGVYYLHLTIANLAVGVIGGLLEKMSAASFWFMHAGLVAAGAGIMLVFALLFRRMLAPTDGDAPA
jgi:POT family proton-dependent oligopeptide transporter